MHEPALALVIFLASVLVAVLLAWPRRGMLARLGRLRRASERVRLEDALKCLYNCEYEARPCTVETVAGALEVSRSQAVSLASRLASRGLARTEGNALALTEEGRAYALRIVRTHRLWERYLADRTGVAPGEWHASAEEREHLLSAEETEALAARLGHPAYDPHGDPIPTASGAVPPQLGVPLTDLAEGQAAVVVHVEDEPQAVYARLLADGLAPGLRLEVVEAGPAALVLEAGGRRVSLERLVAANVTVERLVRPVAEPRETLADLSQGESAVVVGLSPRCQGPQRRRLLDLGVVPGTRIEAELRSTAGDPVAYRIRGALIALRRQQAEWIEVSPERGEEAVA